MGASTVGGDIDALVAAAGAGTRLGLGPKLFITVAGRSLLAHTVASVHDLVSNVFVAVPGDRLEEAGTLLAEFPGATALAGGASRMESYRLAFQRSRADYLVIRDVARPFGSASLAAATVQAARQSRAAAACMDSDVPMARVSNGMLTERVPREQVAVPCNPQCYHRSIMETVFDAFSAPELETLTFWEACILLDLPVSRVPGERRNIKITSREDLELARHFFASPE